MCFVSNLVVICDGGICFYVGVLIIFSDGLCMGVLCVLDCKLCMFFDG